MKVRVLFTSSGLYKIVPTNLYRSHPNIVVIEMTQAEYDTVQNIQYKYDIVQENIARMVEKQTLAEEK